MLDVYKTWKLEYETKLNQALVRNGTVTVVEEIERFKAKHGEDIGEIENSNKKFRSDNDVLKNLICLPLKFIKLVLC